MDPLLVHIGLHRTGSSWLQQRVFDGRDGRPTPVVADRAESARRIVLPREDDFDAAEVRAWLSERTRAVVASGGVPVLSNERFSGNPHSGWFDGERTIDRLAEIVEEPRVLVVLRRQDDLVRSLYLQYVRIGGPASLASYLKSPEPGDHRAPGFDPAFLRYDLLLDRLDRRFGRERVLALGYDLLRRDPRMYLDRIGAFLGTSITPPADARERVYESPAFTDAAWRRRLNFWCVRSTLHGAVSMAGGGGARIAGDRSARRRHDTRLREDARPAGPTSDRRTAGGVRRLPGRQPPTCSADRRGSRSPRLAGLTARPRLAPPVGRNANPHSGRAQAELRALGARRSRRRASRDSRTRSGIH